MKLATLVRIFAVLTCVGSAVTVDNEKSSPMMRRDDSTATPSVAEDAAASGVDGTGAAPQAPQAAAGPYYNPFSRLNMEDVMKATDPLAEEMRQLGMPPPNEQQRKIFDTVVKQLETKPQAEQQTIYSSLMSRMNDSTKPPMSQKDYQDILGIQF